ncbi:GTP-binding protein 10 homolog [Phlebotomus argentipes]|uniref:GTP-binding protein 10 homolog n=1 Tax=Phlebotomus argentipes TaxID=94469 RepID=UPI002892F08E|nr:GTP-binding protein 10 homolog [Phlebotomus argentipes]
MVFLTRKLLQSGVKSLRKHFRPHFLDTLRLTVSGGHGGNGLPKNGGVGGQGGCVYFVAKEDATLKMIAKEHSTKRVKATHGEDSSKVRLLGRRGEDREVKVPVGITVIDETGRPIYELNEEGRTFKAASGGPGGCQGNSFIGQPGQSRTLMLDLKLIADAGLVGFPNAGKSTFLKAVSKARPRIASYPFTTIQPQLGIVQYTDFRQISVADLPGLIEGAHANIGMGHKFLKHVERTRMLILIADIFGFQLSPQHKRRNCLENVYALNRELELYDATLLEKPAILLINKLDIEGAHEEYENIKSILHQLDHGLENCPEEIRPQKLMEFERIIPISAKENVDIGRVTACIRDVLDEAAAEGLSDPDTEILSRRMREVGPKIV